MKRMIEKPANYPPTPEQYQKLIRKFRRLPNRRAGLNLTWIEKSEKWN